MENKRFEKQLAFIGEIDKMKNIFRQNSIINEDRFENDAEHSWHLAVMAAVLFEYSNSDKVNLERVLKMTLIHDIVEVYAGDTFAYDTVGYVDKEKRENSSAEKIFGLLPEDQKEEFISLWREFDAMQTPDAIYASAMDRLQPLILNYFTKGYTWRHHRVCRSQIYKRLETVKIATPALWSFVDQFLKSSIEKGLIIDE